MKSSFAYDKEKFVFQFVGQFDAAELQAPAPSCHVDFLHGVQDVAELFDFLFRISVGRMSLEAVQFLVVVVFYLFAYGSQQTFLFANLMLSAAFTVYCYDGRSFLQLSTVYFLLYVPVVEISGNQSEEDHSCQYDDKYPHDN